MAGKVARTACRSPVLILAATLLLCSAAARADELPVVSINREVGIFASGLMQSYREQNTNPAIPSATLDTEYGWTPGFSLEASYLFGPEIYAGLNYEYNDGLVRYGGYGVNAPYRHASLTSGETINDLGLEIGKGFLFGRLLLIPTIQGGYRNWDRVVPGGLSPEEQYSFFAAGLAAHATYMLTNRLALTSKIGWEYTIDPTDHSTANPAAAVPAATFAQGSRPVWQVAMGVDYRLWRGLHAVAKAEYTHFSFGESSAVTYSVAGRRRGEYEPTSTTDDLVLKAGVAWGF